MLWLLRLAWSCLEAEPNTNFSWYESSLDMSLIIHKMDLFKTSNDADSSRNWRAHSYSILSQIVASNCNVVTTDLNSWAWKWIRIHRSSLIVFQTTYSQPGTNLEISYYLYHRETDSHGVGENCKWYTSQI